MQKKPKTKKKINQKNGTSTNSTKSNNRAKKDAFNFDEEIVIGLKTKATNNEKNKSNPNIKKKNKKNSAAKTNKSKAKKKKKKINTKVIKAILKILCLIGLIAGTIAFLMISPVFNIAEIEITNNQKISKDTYISLSGIKYGENIYRINKKDVEEKIKSENAYVQDVKIKRVLPNKLTVEVQERTATYMIEVDGTYMYLDNQGYILEKSKEKLEVPILLGIETDKENITVNNRLCEEDLQKLNKVLEIYRAASTTEINSLITKIDISDTSNYKLILESEKKTVHLGDATDLVNKFKWVKTMIENEKDKKGDIYANRDLNSQPVYFSPSK